MSKTQVSVDLGLRNASDFWQQIVSPNYEEYRRAETVQTVLNVAWSLWHFQEWLADEQSGQQADFRKAILLDCPCLRLLQDVCDAAKHRILDRPKVLVERMAQATGKGGAGGYGVATSGYGVGAVAYGSAAVELKISVVTPDGDRKEHWVSEVIEEVFAYWRGHRPDLSAV